MFQQYNYVGFIRLKKLRIILIIIIYLFTYGLPHQVKS